MKKAQEFLLRLLTTECPGTGKLNYYTQPLSLQAWATRWMAIM